MFTRTKLPSPSPKTDAAVKSVSTSAAARRHVSPCDLHRARSPAPPCPLAPTPSPAHPARDLGLRVAGPLPRSSPFPRRSSRPHRRPAHLDAPTGVPPPRPHPRHRRRPWPGCCLASAAQLWLCAAIDKTLTAQHLVPCAAAPATRSYPPPLSVTKWN